MLTAISQQNNKKLFDEKFIKELFFFIFLIMAVTVVIAYSK